MTKRLEELAMPMCERCGEYPATDVDELCDFCKEADALAALASTDDGEEG